MVEFSTGAQMIANVLASMDVPHLCERPEWGAINFSDLREKMDDIRSLGTVIQSLDTGLLPANIQANLEHQIGNVIKSIGSINDFKIDVENATEKRDQLHNNFVGTSEELLEFVGPWVGYLAYRSGEIPKLFASIHDEALRVRTRAEEAEATAKARLEEVEAVVQAAKDAAGASGLAGFAQIFEQESQQNQRSSSAWLLATAGLAVLTICAGIISFFVMPSDEIYSSVSLAISKIFVLAVLITATLWSGRVYRAFKHQAFINTHRARALQCFRAFVESTDSPDTREAILLETTRSIFAIGSSGMIDRPEATGQQRPMILEMTRMARSQPTASSE